MSARKQNNRRAARQQQVRPVTPHEQFARFIVLSMLAVSLSSLLVWQLQQWLLDPDTLPVKVVKIEGDLKRLEIAELEKSVAGHVSGGYFNIDLERVRSAAQNLAWVDGISIQRRWPDTIIMTIIERAPMARWGEKKLVTESGVVFEPQNNLPEGLPRLVADEAKSVQVVAFFKQEKARFEQVGLQLDGVELNNRGGWSMHFSNGLRVAIGRNEIEQRLNRLEHYLAVIRDYRGMPEYIDLRYSYGMAVNFGKQQDQQESAQQAEKEAV
jgi:cell division protein FtsQ